MNTFDFNALTIPTLDVTMQDEARTILHLTDPTVDLLERFTAAAKDARLTAKKKDAQTIQAFYELFAGVFSCNADGVTVTPEELRDKYRLSIVHLIAFMPAYIDYINEIKSAKN